MLTLSRTAPLVFLFAGCAIAGDTDGDEVTSQPATPGALSRALDRALRDGFVSTREWRAQIAPLAAALPRAGSPDGNTLALLWADSPHRIAATAYAELRSLLDASGYPVPRSDDEPALSGDQLIAENLTTPDLDFEDVARSLDLPDDATTTIAVLDDGVTFEHPALAGRQVARPGKLRQWDFVDGDASLPATIHGTAVASIATRGGLRVRALALRIAVNAGIPRDLAFGEVVGDAIDTAAAEGVGVVSLSYVTNQAADIALIRGAMQRHPDVLFVLAAGNGNSQLGATPGLGPDQFLATMHADNVMIVANATRDGVRFESSFDGSNYGTPYVDVAIRGIDLPLAIAAGGYGRSRGTSSATPNAASVAARVRLLAPGLTAAQVKQLLLDTATPSAAWAGLANAGLIDPARALRAAAAR